MSEYYVRIERAENGYTVLMRDPAIVKANQKRDLSARPSVPYMDPHREYVFADFNALSAFLKVNLDKALPKPDYVSAFDNLVDDDEDD